MSAIGSAAEGDTLPERKDAAVAEETQTDEKVDETHTEEAPKAPRAKKAPEAERIDTAPPVGAALFGTREQEEEHVLSQREKIEKFKVPEDKMPAAGISGEVIASATFEGSVPVLYITPVGWTGIPPIKFGLFELDDAIKSLQELKRKLK